MCPDGFTAVRRCCLWGAFVRFSLSWSGRGSLPATPGERRARHRWRGRFTAVAVAAVLVSSLPAAAWAVPPTDPDRAGVDLIDLQKDTPADGSEGEDLGSLTSDGVTQADDFDPEHTADPATGAAVAALDAPAAGDQTQAGDLPVLIGVPDDATPQEATALAGDWQVDLASPDDATAADVDGGLLLSVTPPPGATGDVTVSVNYTDFADLYSADWADRLQFVQYPDCFVSSPDSDNCDTPSPVTTDNDDTTGEVTATLDAADLAAVSSGADTASARQDAVTSDGVYRGKSKKASALQALLPAEESGSGTGVLGVTDSGSGSKGDYTATPLTSAGSWAQGGSSGAFTYQYKVSTPAVPAGPAPDITFQYNSQSVDGRTSASNNQSSWLGEGWDYNPGSIERTYRSCASDTADGANNAENKTSDECWGSDNVVLTFGGSTTALVQSDTDKDLWVTQNGDGSRVERLHDTGKHNGDNDGEYWRVTTNDGTQYYYGLNMLPGWQDGDPYTNSVLTVPVAGNQSNEPCHATTFADSFCQQGWRWSLDYVVDPDGNAMSLWWTAETNHYAKNNKYDAPVSYDSGGYLDTIKYGQRSNTLFTADPIARVSLNTGERCFAEGDLTCDEAAFTSRDYSKYRIWYDTPAHLYCSGDSDTKCRVPTPTFWSRKRLESITTYTQRDPATTDLSKVDTYSLSQSFPEETEGSPSLWLQSISRTGYDTAGESEKLNPVEFGMTTLANRVVEGSDDPRPGFDRPRVNRVVSEYGGETDVTYSKPTGYCATGSGYPKQENNTGLCFPVTWAPDPDVETVDWFNKYVVDSVTEKPRVDGVPDTVTDYEYVGGGAWAKDDTEFSKKKTRTYDQWRGYTQVNTLSGETDSANGTVRSKSATRYFRGMDGDQLPDGTTRSVSMTDSQDTVIATDAEALAGQTAETITYDSASSSTIISRTVTVPETTKLAARARGDGLPELVATRTQTARTTTYTPASNGGGAHKVTIATTYDDDGNPKTVETTGDGDTTETCTTTTYNQNASAHILGLPKQVRTTVGDCDDASTADLVSADRTYYDDATGLDTAPAKGHTTREDTNDATGTGWITDSKTTYDAYGRITTVTDAANTKARTVYLSTTDTNATIDTSTTDSAAYTAVQHQVYATVAYNGLSQKSTATVDPARGIVLRATDANNNATSTAYDPLGRTLASWTASQDPKTDDPAVKYAYDTDPDKPVAVTTSTLRDNGTYADSITIFDGLGRERQTQTEAVGSGRIISDTLYNANGQIGRTNNGYYAESEPDTELFVPVSDYTIPSITLNSYDGQGRPAQVLPEEAGKPVASKSTTYSYGSDWSTVDPPRGAVKSTSWSDSLGRTSRIDEYTTKADSGHVSTSFTYDARGNRHTAKDTEGNTWSWDYDDRGRLKTATDPDTGTTDYTYDALDRPVTTTDENGTTVWTGYDALGRTTGQRLDNDSGTKLTEFTYDTAAGGVGQPAASTRYTGGAAYITTVGGYDAEYRPSSSSTTIPDTTATKGLAGTYEYDYTYTRTGLLQSTTSPKAGALSAEKVITRYNADDLPTSTSGLDWYTAETTYSPYGEVLRSVTGEQPYRVWTSNVYDENTGQLTRTVSDRETDNAHRVLDRTYQYDPAGNVTEITQTTPTTTDRQCFTYDDLVQLTEAWTSTNETCTNTDGTRTPDAADGSTNVSTDSSSYWQTYTYDSLGNRKELVEHDTTGSGSDTTSDYAYDPDQPHTLTGVTSDNGSVTSQANLDYDDDGQTLSRTYGGDTQNITWTWDHKVDTVTGFGDNGKGEIVNSSSMCLDLASASTTTGTGIQIYTCNGSKAQRFKLDAKTGALTILGRCVIPSGDATAKGTAVVITTCTGAANQKWTLDGNRLKHTSSGLCLEVPASNYTAGTDLQINTCDSTDKQVWQYSDRTSYIYDASGNRIVAYTTTSHTLYLADTEVSTDSTGALAYTQRYYGQAGTPTVMRTCTRSSTTSTLTSMVADQNGTSIATVGLGDGQSVEYQNYDPFGVQRGEESGTWKSHRGYLGSGTDDSTTGLVHLGAREYDPETGRFISADPLLDLGDALQMNGYAYANNDPVSSSDPSGLQAVLGYDGIASTTTIKESKDADGDTTVTYTTHSSTTNQVVTTTVTQVTTVSKPPPCDWWCHAKGWVKKHKIDIITIATEVVVGGLCNAAAIPADAATFGAAAVGAAVACGSLAGAVGGAVGNAFDKNADHSVDGFGAAVASGTKYGGISGLAGAAGGAVIKGVARSVRSLLGKAASGGSRAAAEAGGAEAGAARAEAAGSSGTKTCSFLVGTRVLLADGSSKAIQDLKLGDKVVATDPETGETKAETVSATIADTGYKKFVKVTVDVDGKKGSKTASVTDTFNHPVWVASLDAWVNATDLKTGDWLRTASGTRVQITAVKRWSVLQATVHNLTVSELHTYYVLAGETPVLVHNSTPCTPAIGPQRPTGVGDDWVARGADNGKGSVWQKSGSTGNADMLRVMNPTGRYPDGYVRFTNKHGQPIGLDGKPGSKADTHIPMNPDGTYPLPVGW